MNETGWYVQISVRGDLLSDDAALSRFAEALLDSPALAPSMMGFDERRREPIDRARILPALKAQRPAELLLWRTKAPKYFAYTNISPHNGARWTIEFRPEPPPLRAKETLAELTRIIELLEPELASIAPWPKDGSKAVPVGRGYRFPEDIYFWGLADVHARTWFGPFISEQLRREGVDLGELATPTPWGGMRIDLVDDLTTATGAEIFASEALVRAKLDAAGLVARFTDISLASGWTAAPNWTPPTWLPPPPSTRFLKRS